MKEHSFKISLITLFVLISSPSISYSSTILLRRSYAEDLLTGGKTLGRSKSSSFPQSAQETAELIRPSDPPPYDVPVRPTRDENPIHATSLPKSEPLPAPSKPGFFHSLSTSIISQWNKFQFFIEKTRALPFFRKGKVSLFTEVSKMDEAFGVVKNLQPHEVTPRVTPVVQSLRQPGTRSKVFTPSALKLSESQLLEKLDQPLNQLKKLLEESSTAERSAQKDALALARHLEPHAIADKFELQSVTGPLATQGYFQRQEDLSDISRQLDEDIKYIATLHRILGPDSVLADSTKALLRESRIQEEWKIPEKWDSENFVQEVINLRPHYEEILTYRDQFLAARQAGSTRTIPQPSLAISKMREFHNTQSEQLKLLQGPTLTEITNKLSRTDLFRGFYADLNNPGSNAAHQLVLLEPLGIARNPDFISFNRMHFERFGLLNNNAAFKALTSPPDSVKANALKRIEHATEAMKIKEQLLEVFTPAGLDVFAERFGSPKANVTPP